MGTTADKLNKIFETKEAIRTAINNKGGTLTETDTFASYATAIDNIKSGGSGGGEEKSIYVDFLDGDGTLLKREYLDVGGTATPPDDPNLDSDYLTFSGWSDMEFTNITKIKTIYAIYITKDNATYIFIHIPTANKAIMLRFGGTVTSVDWGDGTTDATLSHTYSATGDYVIKVIGGTSIPTNILNSTNDNTFVLKCYLSNTIKGLNSAFNQCFSLKSIILPKDIKVIGPSTFYQCFSLESINLPSTITAINSQAFLGCYTLKNISFPSGVTSIGKGAFTNCYLLKNITLPSGVTSLDNTFYGCYALTNINISSSITKLGDNVFAYCHSLSSISLPSSITTLGSATFSSCYNIQQVIINANSVVTIQSNSFAKASYGTKFYVPDNLVEDYKVATNWVKFADRIYPLSSLGV